MTIVGDELQRCQEYVDALQEERRKIVVFGRELPLCLELVTQAIEACKQSLSETTPTPECNSEQTTSDGGPVFEEFMPIKRNSCSDDEHESHKSKKSESLKKSDWLESAQLWLGNQTLDLPKKEVSPEPVPVPEVKRNCGGGGDFHPFKRETIDRTSGSGNRKNEKDGQEQRKVRRRCWSPELHRLFLHALQHLGGSHVATPKQIREIMKIDGLTNDEVKSHLQKYRLHDTARPSTSVRRTYSYNPQTPQFVAVGPIWAPPPEYALPLQQTQQRQQVKQLRSSRSDERRSRHGEDSNSPASSSLVS